MSLLLDALKKAADDKQKALQAESKAPALLDSSSSKPDNENTNIEDSGESLHAEQGADLQGAEDPVVSQGHEYTEELTLEDVTADIAEAKLGEDNTDGLSFDEDQQEHENHSGNDREEKKQNEELRLDNTSNHSADRFTVSDEALSMLVYKTNRDVKRSKKIIMAGALAASLAVLVSGGVFYYLDMQAEIATLERKHQIAMQAMHAKTNKEKTHEKSEIIRNLVSESNLDEKVQYAKRHLSADKNTSVTPAKVNKKSGKHNSNATILSIQKSKTSDPVGGKLDSAWLAYENGEYHKAKNIYKDVLTIERNNRDALLGLGAIAVIEKDNTVARDIYLSLLEQDPRDSMATAALAGLHDESALKSDEEYLLSMLEKNPGAQHLNFALGNNYAKQNKWKFAQQHYFDAWQSDNKNADYIFNLAVSMDQLNKRLQAINFYKGSLLKAGNKQVGFSREAVQTRINELSEL